VSKNDKNLSPIARRTFFKKAGGVAMLGVGVVVGATLVGGAQGCATYSDYSDNCGYCDGCGRNYYHCDGSYCNYGNYGDGC
jgi:hypothetical protein